MDCKKAERLLLYSLDGRLKPGEKLWLEDHIIGCSRCQKANWDYRIILGCLKKETAPEPLPYFNERLLAKLSAEEKAISALFWQRWAAKAMAFSLAALFVIGAAFFAFRAPEPQELSPVETLLLQDENPLIEAKSVLDESMLENKNMMLIFSSMEETGSPRR